MKFPEKYRWKNAPFGYASDEDDDFGVFILPPLPREGGGNTRRLKVIANSATPGVPWEHVSVSLAEMDNTTPNWAEMCLVKNLFWNEHEVAIQIHPKKSEYVNHHKGCLHLWRWTHGEFPLPPVQLV